MSIATAPTTIPVPLAAPTPLPTFLRETRDNAGPHRLGVHAYCHACGREFGGDDSRYICDTLRSEYRGGCVCSYHFHLACVCGAGDGAGTKGGAA